MYVFETLKKVTESRLVIRSFKISLVVGTILVGVNYGDSILKGDLEQISWTKITLTYMVPYLVSTYSALANNSDAK